MLSEFFVNFTLQGTQQWPEPQFLNRMLKQKIKNDLRQYRIIPALRLKHRSDGCGTASALPKCSIRHPVLSALLAQQLPHLARRIGT